MQSVEVTKEVNAPAERVWEIITDLDGAVEVISGIISIERLDGGSGFRVGTRWRETRKMMGKEASEDMEIVSIQPGRAYVAKAGNAKVEYRSKMFVESRGSGCVVGMSLEAHSKTVGTKILAATIGRLFAGATRKIIVQDLNDIAAAAES